MPISLSLKANYKTQASVYDALALQTSRLTNSKIVRYAKEGRYGPDLQARFSAKRERTPRTSNAKARAAYITSLVDNLLND